MILNLGCGLNKVPSTVNVDYSDICKPDVKWDLNEVPYPFEDESADHIIMNHVLEHLDNTAGVLSECNRILKWDGTMVVAVPHASHDLALGDKFHRRMITEHTFMGCSSRSGEDLEAMANYSLEMEKHEVRFGRSYKWVAKMPKRFQAFCSDNLRNIARESVFHLKKKKKCIALSFDDGPTEYTEQALDILKRLDAKATFFTIGLNMRERPETTKRIIEEGHEIGLHGYAHEGWDTKEVVRAEVNRWIETFKMILPYREVRYFRPPYVHDYARMYPGNLKIKELNKMVCVDYTTVAIDWEDTTPFEIIHSTTRTARNNGVILLHDGYHKESKKHDRSATIDAIEPLVKMLRNNGFIISSLKELEDIQYGRAVS